MATTVEQPADLVALGLATSAVAMASHAMVHGDLPAVLFWLRVGRGWLEDCEG